MKKLIAFIFILVCVLGLAGCNEKQEDTENYVFRAKVVEIGSGTMLVKPLQGYPEADYAQQVSVGLRNVPGSPEPRVGDIVEITYNGIMAETYPPVPSGVEKIIIVNDAE